MRWHYLFVLAASLLTMGMAFAFGPWGFLACGVTILFVFALLPVIFAPTAEERRTDARKE